MSRRESKEDQNRSLMYFMTSRCCQLEILCSLLWMKLPSKYLAISFARTEKLHCWNVLGLMKRERMWQKFVETCVSA